MADPTRLARSGSTDQDGKLVARIDVLMTEQMYDDIVALASLRGIPKAEAARRAIERSLYGEMAMVRRVAEQIDGVDGRNHG